MIRARGIQKSLGSIDILKQIDLDIPEGEISAIIGPSGAGKTTLLQILGTLDKPDAGTLEIDGQNVEKLHGRALANFRNRRIGFVFQFHRLLPEFSALENVLMPAWIHGANDRKTRDRAEGLLRNLGLGDRLSHKPEALSGGEQQRVAAARALMNDPAVVLADEPTGNLDSSNAEGLFDLFAELRDLEGQTLVIVTHNEGLAKRADRRFQMEDGHIVKRP
ncbi:MAG: ABC transporter ATP-binding protein [Flavobacteriales bacterium]